MVTFWAYLRFQVLLWTRALPLTVNTDRGAVSGAGLVTFPARGAPESGKSSNVAHVLRET